MCVCFDLVLGLEGNAEDIAKERALETRLELDSIASDLVHDLGLLLGGGHLLDWGGLDLRHCDLYVIWIIDGNWEGLEMHSFIYCKFFQRFLFAASRQKVRGAPWVKRKKNKKFPGRPGLCAGRATMAR